jgi:acetamidase/formamidase
MSGGSVPFAIPWRRSLSRAKVPAEDPSDLAQLIYQQYLIDLLTREENLPPIDAYMLCSVCADLRVSQIVDAPNWTVSCYFPRMVF